MGTSAVKEVAVKRREFGKVAAATLAAATVGKVGVDAIDDASQTGLASPAASAPPTQAPPPQAPSAVPKVQGAARQVQQVIVAERKLEGAGFEVRRPFPSRAAKMLDPFVLLDELGPIQWKPGEAVGAPDHPHRGFETVSYLLQGGVKHADSLGNHGSLGPGDVQWMTAGAGIVHAELPPDHIRYEGGAMHAFQIWVNLPRRLKMTKPRYQEVRAPNFPIGRSLDGRVQVRVIAGQALKVNATIDVHTPIVLQHWIVSPGGAVKQPLPRDHNGGVYVFAGAGRVADRALKSGELAVLGPGDHVSLETPVDAGAPMEALLLGGVPHNEPVVQWGPFVMNDMGEIRQAFADFRAGKMGYIPKRG